MNAAAPAAVSGEMMTPPAPAVPPINALPPIPPARPAKLIEPPFDLPRLLAGLVLGVGAFDFCFWGITGLGFSLGLFVALLTGVILGNRQRLRPSRVTLGLLALLSGAVMAATLETGFTNTLVLAVLIVALAGQTYFTGADSVWGRVISQMIALLGAPGRVFWLGARMMESGFKGGVGSIRSLLGGILVVVPALFLAVVFGSLLSTGNAVFGSWVNSFLNWIGRELSLYLNFGRICLWFVAAFVMLPLLRPTSISEGWWRWTERLPRLPEIVPSRGAFLSSTLVLLVLNVMFFVANLADACFLWSGKSLPPGVTYSGYVHSGTNALTATVILSAVVLTVIFQQSLQVARRRELKALAYAWIAQNLFLLTSVALRLKLYIQAYDMTVERLGVIIFLVLVATGFVLLIVKILQDRSLSWLIGSSILAVLATLYITQFLDLGGWSANYNVARWEKDRSRDLDLYYIYDQGAAGWPALRHAIDLGATWKADGDRYKNVNDPLLAARQDEASAPRAQFDPNHWREFSLRAYLNRWALEENPNK